MNWIKKLIIFVSISLSQQTWLNSSVSKYILTRFQPCFERNNMLNCVKNETLNILDTINRDKSEWKINDVISLTSDFSNKIIPRSIPNIQNSFLNMVKEKLYYLMQARYLQIKFFSSGEGRKKKGGGKHPGMMMVGGLALMGMIAQLILGKVTALSTVALILAKIALLFSTLNGLKKSSSSQPDVYVDPHGGYGNTWQRSLIAN